MKRQPYYPKTLALQPEWHFNYATQLTELTPVLGVDTAQATASVNDSRFLGYALGEWLTGVREFGPGVTGELDTLRWGTGTENFVLPPFVPPAEPENLVAVKPGALARIFKFVQTIKSAPGYTEGRGLLLGVVGSEDTVEHDRPTFSLALEQGSECQCVRISFRKYGHYAVAIYCRRAGGLWELLGIDAASPYLDDRPLLVPGTPEIREYRMRFWDKGIEIGEWTDPGSITVSL